MEQLVGMGFSEAQAKRALAEAGNVDGAVNFIFENADKPPSFWEPRQSAADVLPTASGESGEAEAALPLAPSAATVEGELPGVLGELRPVKDVAAEALKDPAFLAELLAEAAGVDVDRVVQTITGLPAPQRLAGAGSTPEAVAEKAVDYFVSALDKRWGEYVGALNVREVRFPGQYMLSRSLCVSLRAPSVSPCCM